ncbi:MAG TPA: carboxypeptidase-like regulatory domain-containing protein, partial [Planctomycetota bacterium]|nr:carboxypeptidase-like regulatory domain-containing protein [Planctomycetota bacterium]
HVLPVPDEVDVRASAEVPRIESEGALETPPDRELDLFGEVVDVYGQPLAGVVLNALEPARAGDHSGCVQPQGSAVLATTLSDGEGRFRIRLERGQECTLEAAWPGLATVHLVERRAGERVQVVLGHAARLSGRVVRASDGSGVEGAVIRLRERRATFVVRMPCREMTTDADGSYAFEGMPAGAYDPWVTCPSDPGLWASVMVLVPGQSLEHEFVVPASLDVRGRVVDAESGDGIAQAEVSLSPFYETSVRTASDGSFLLHGWSPEEMGRSVHARADGHVHGARALPRGAAEAVDFELVLARGAGVTGRILGPTGAPQPDARVEVHGSLVRPAYGRDRWSVHTEPDGRFELLGLHRDQNYTLVASAHGAGRLVVDLPDFDPERDPSDLGDLDLPVSSSLAGRVVDGNGRPVPGAFVRLFGGDPGRNRLRAPSQEPLAPFVPVITLRLDDLGRFWASDLAGGEYTLTAEATGLSIEAQTSVSLGEGEQREGLELVLELGARIAGRVVGPDGEPVALALIDAVPSDDGPIAHMITRSDGSFELSGLGEGLHTLAIEHFPGRGNRTYCDARVEGVRTGTLDLHIVLPEAVPVTGVVLASDGAPLPEATVQIDHHDGRLGGMSTVKTDSQGRFRLLVPADAPVDLVAADWRKFSTEGSTDIPQGRVERVEPGATDLVIRIEP